MILTKLAQASKEVEDIEYHWALGDEWANALTHGLGLFLSLIGFFFLIQIPLNNNDHWKLFSFTIYGMSLIILYGASTLYHSFRNKRLKYLFRLIDHCAIYLLIAGSYTPFMLISLKGPWGWTLFTIVWLLAILGIIFKLFFIGRFNRISTAFYLLMGWLAVIAIEPLINNLPLEALYWILAGGLCYTAGVIFFALDRFPFYHAVWHLFVLGGSACHYLAVCFYV